MKIKRKSPEPALPVPPVSPAPPQKPLKPQTPSKKKGCVHSELDVKTSVEHFEEECSLHQLRVTASCKSCGEHFVFTHLPMYPQKAGAWCSNLGKVGHFCIIPFSKLQGL